MIQVRRSAERGRVSHGWLDTYHTFSFGTYHDPEHMGFRDLRVLNEDWIQAGKGFPPHPHQDMEILTYILEGELEHRDSMGTGSVIGPGELQRMSAGTGVVHSERNPSPENDVHLFQVWILPERPGLTPGYEQKQFRAEEKKGKLKLIASRDGAEGSITLHQDVRLYAGVLDPGDTGAIDLRSGRHGWVQVASGGVRLGDRELEAGDGAAVSDEPGISLSRALPGTEVLVFDLN